MNKFKRATAPFEGVVEVIVPDARLCIKAVHAMHHLDAIHDTLIHTIDLLEGADRQDVGEASARCNEVYDFIHTLVATIEDEDDEDD